MKIYNIGIDLKRTFTDVLRGIVQHEDVLFKTVISDDGKPIDYSTCNIIMVAVRMPDYTTEKTLETINIQTANATKGIVEFKLPKEFTEQEGVHQLQIAFFDNGNMVKTARFNYCVEDGLLLDEPSETEIKTTEDLLRKASEALVTSQEISGAENARIAAEEARISNELERKDAEAFRNERELSRGRAEADRKEAEDRRLENEAERIENERERGNNENERIEAEVRRENKLNNMDINAISIDSESEAYAETLITEDSISVTIGVPKGEKGDKGDKGDPFTYDDFTEENKNDLLKDTATKEELEKCFKFETGYEDEIDSYVGLLGKGKWYEINPPKDEFVISWETYYIFAMLSNSGEILQVKFFENNKGFYFRTGRKADAFSSPQWGEWSKTVLSNEIESVVEENSTKLITSGGVYAAIGDIEASLENIINKYGLGGEA